MSLLVIRGGRKLSGKTKIYGAKNSILPILAATIVVNGVSTIHNCPNLSDVNSAIDILLSLGCTVKRDCDTIIIDSSKCNQHDIDEKMMHKMRSSILFLGSILARFGKATLYPPGGCDLGPRPIDIHIKSFELMNAKIECIENRLECVCEKGLQNCDITLPIKSVGVTENIIIASTISKGRCILKNYAKEPEIFDLIDFLKKSGANISFDDEKITIIGVKELHSTEHTVVEDRIVLSTLLCATAITNGEVEITNCNLDNISAVKSQLEKMGCVINNDIVKNRYFPLTSNSEINSAPYPAFPTDSLSSIMSLACICKGYTKFTETIFKNRFNCVKYLQKMGAKIEVNANSATVFGVDSLVGCDVYAEDLRGGAGLVVAGLCAEGKTIVHNIEHIDRGYVKIEEQLHNLGADIQRIDEV